MAKSLTITLDSLDLGQLLEGLQSRAESWRNTASYLESGYSEDEAFVCEVCTDSDEAVRIAQYFEKIIGSIERQVDEQGGW